MSFSAFLAFPGQGSQHLSMLSKGGIEDIAHSSSYSHIVECCSDLISIDVFKLIEDGPEDLINQTSITQPLLVLCSYLHYEKLINSIDINSNFLAGHSLGEYSALVAADSIHVTDALMLVRKRGELMENAPGGSMSAIMGLDQDIIVNICSNISSKDNLHVQCANLNSPNQTVISGDIIAIDQAQKLCIEQGAKRAIKLNVSIASHSKLMIDAAKDFEKILKAVDIKMPDKKIFHNVSVGGADSIEDLHELLVSQLYKPVRWVEICDQAKLLNLPIIECGPGKVLSGLFKNNGLENYFYTSDEEFYEKIISNG